MPAVGRRRRRRDADDARNFQIKISLIPRTYTVFQTSDQQTNKLQGPDHNQASEQKVNSYKFESGKSTIHTYMIFISGSTTTGNVSIETKTIPWPWRRSSIKS